MTSEKLKALTDKEWQVDSVDNNGNQWRIKYVPVINNPSVSFNRSIL